MRDGFRRVEPLFSSEPLNDVTLLEQKLRQLLERRGFVTVESFRVAAGSDGSQKRASTRF